MQANTLMFEGDKLTRITIEEPKKKNTKSIKNININILRQN